MVLLDRKDLSIGERYDGPKSDFRVRPLERHLGVSCYLRVLLSPNQKEKIGFVIDVFVDVGFVEWAPGVNEFGGGYLAAEFGGDVVEELLLVLFILEDVGVEVFGVGFFLFFSVMRLYCWLFLLDFFLCSCILLG